MSQAASDKCARCKKPLNKKNCLRCSACNAAYDLDCINISVQRFNSFYAPDKKRRDDWKCPECTKGLPKLDQNTPARPTPAHKQNRELSSHVTERAKPSPNIDADKSVDCANDRDGSIMFPEDPMTDFKRFWEEMRAVRMEMSYFRSTLSDLTAVIKSQNSRIDALEGRIETLEGKITGTQGYETSKLEETISHLRSEIEDRNQEMLGNDIEIACLPEVSHENATHVMLTIAKKLGVELEERDVVSAQRVGPPREAPGSRPRPLVVRLARHAQQDALLQAARVRRRLSTDGMNLPGAGAGASARHFYVNERLTRHNRQLFQRARETAKRLSWKFVWTRNGKIFVRQDNGKVRHWLRSDEDMVKVFGDNSVGVSK